MTATAEGVESEPQMRALESLECDKVQGYLLGRPRPAASMAGLLSSKLPVKAPGRR
jgi:EAL domain-containing protein (putative c-di-GMP-specific phosphodiesterase class I)